MGQLISGNGTSYITKWDILYHQMGQHISPNGTRYITHLVIYFVHSGGIWDKANGTRYIKKWDNIYEQMGQYISRNGTRYITYNIWDNIIIWNSIHIEILYGDILHHKMGQDISCPLISDVPVISGL